MKFAHPLYLTITTSVLFTSDQNEILSTQIHHGYNQVISGEVDLWRFHLTTLSAIMVSYCKSYYASSRQLLLNEYPCWRLSGYISGKPNTFVNT